MFESQAKAIKSLLPSFSFLRGQEFCNWYLDKHDSSTSNEVTADTAQCDQLLSPIFCAGPGDEACEWSDLV